MDIQLLDKELGILNRTGFFQKLKQQYLIDLTQDRQSLFIAMEYECISQLRGVLSAENITWLLIKVVDIYTSCLPSHAIVGRSLKEIDAYIVNFDEAQLPNLIENLTLKFNTPILLPTGQAVEIKPRFISAMTPGVLLHTESPDKVISQMAMYLGYCDQSENKKQHCHLDQVTSQLLNRRVEIDSQILTALGNNEMFLAYQPKVDLTSQKIIGCEALARWQHPSLGFVSPDEFIERAEFCGVIQALTLWVLKQSIETLAKCRVLNPDFTMAINLSATCIETPDFFDEIKFFIKHSGIPPQLFVFEVTESIAIENYELAVEFLQKLRELGCKVSLDDFGTGYSSLSVLSKLPLDSLKVDRSFIKNMLNSDADIEIVRTINRLGHACGLKVIAEGIETKQDMQIIADSIGCDYGQGYYFAKPINDYKLLKHLAENLKMNSPEKANDLFISRFLSKYLKPASII